MKGDAVHEKRKEDLVEVGRKGRSPPPKKRLYYAVTSIGLWGTIAKTKDRRRSLKYMGWEKKSPGRRRVRKEPLVCGARGGKDALLSVEEAISEGVEGK